MQRTHIGLLTCLLALPLSAGAQDKPAGKSGPYLDVVQRTADTLLENARDTFGEEHSGMILSVLDAKTGEPLKKLPEGPFGIRWGDRTGPGGSNANLQLDLYRSFDHLSRLTGDPKYSEAAKQALVDFMRITQHPETGFLAWGEHLYWNNVEDRLGDDLDKNRTHEQKRKFLYYDKLLDWDKERALKYADGLWEHQIADQETGDFSRHARYDRHAPRKGWDFPKEAGYFIHIWSEAYAATKDEKWIKPVRVMAGRYQSRMSDIGLMDFDTSGGLDRLNWSVTLANLSLGVEAHEAAPRMDAQTAEQLRKLATDIDRGFLALKHEVSDPTKGFICYAHTQTGEPFPVERKKSVGYSPTWGMGYGINTTSMIAILCNTRQAQLGKGEQGDAYRNYVIEAAKLYQTVDPDPQKDDIWVGEYGLAILTELAAHRLTGDASYLERAKALGDMAVELFWKGGDQPLPTASSKTRYYDVTAYPDTLIMSLLALHEATEGLPPQVEITDLIR